MSSNDIHAVRPGWTVKSADGARVGSVAEVSETAIVVKHGMLGDDRWHLPLASLARVDDEANELAVEQTDDELRAGDWSSAPAEPPRAGGAPLNAESDEAIDELMKRP